MAVFLFGVSMQKTIRTSGRFAHYRYLKTDFDRIRIKVAGYDRANDQIIELAFFAKGEKKPFEKYRLFDSDTRAFIDILRNYLELITSCEFYESTHLLEDECDYLFWIIDLDNSDLTGIYIFDKDGEKAFDLNISRNNLRMFYAAFCEVVRGG